MRRSKRVPVALLCVFFVALAATTLLSGCCCFKRAPRRECLKKDGCPDKTPLVKCGDRVTAVALPLGTVLANPHAHRGKTTTIRSRLRRGGGVCTMLYCAPGTCCNGCGAMFMLTTAAKPDQSHPHTVLLMNWGKGPHPHPKLACGGDDSLICCPFRTGQEVVVTGRFKRSGRSIYGETWRLESPRICLP